MSRKMYIIGLIILIILSSVVFMKQPKFGKLPKGVRFERIKNSPNYRNGNVPNIVEIVWRCKGCHDVFKQRYDLLFDVGIPH
jgi:hypothetical protein